MDMDIQMLTAEAFSYPGGHVCMEQAAWIAPSLYTPVNPKPFFVYSLVVNIWSNSTHLFHIPFLRVPYSYSSPPSPNHT